MTWYISTDTNSPSQFNQFSYHGGMLVLCQECGGYLSVSYINLKVVKCIKHL